MNLLLLLQSLQGIFSSECLKFSDKPESGSAATVQEKVTLKHLEAQGREEFHNITIIIIIIMVARKADYDDIGARCKS